MSNSGFIYRQIQKWNYHFSTNSFEKKIAEINRNELLISSQPSTFTVKGCDLLFSKKTHSFIVDQFDLFLVLLKGKGKFRIEKDSLLYRVDQTILRITTAEEIFIIHEIFFDRCYLILAPGPFHVIDIGMNVGFASLFFASQPKVLKVHGFEPFRPTFNDAVSNLSLNPQLDAKIETHNFGLSAKAELRTVDYSAVSKGKNSIEDKVSGDETIQLKDASSVFSELINKNPQEKYFVKMDCEGAEFEIFESLQKQPFPNQIFGFIIEWHFKDPQQIVDVLVSNNFKVQLRGDSEIGLIIAFR